MWHVECSTVTALLVLQTYHWEEKRKIEQYYYDLAKLNKAQSAQQEG